MQPQQPQQQPQGGFYPQPVVPYPAAPPAAPAAPDLSKFKEEVVADLQDTVRTLVAQNQPQQQQGDQTKHYDDWGTVFNDVDQRIEQKLQEREQQAQQVNQTTQQQQAEYDKQIDESINNLRGAGYLPPVQNQFDNNDPGKQAETELIGYALALGTTNLAKAAEELKFRHDAGYKYDPNARQFVSLKEQDQAVPGQPEIFGNFNEQPAPQAPPRPQMPVPVQPYVQPGYPQPMGYPQQPAAPAPYPYPVGPSNPYMMPVNQYPAGFNAPVSNGGSFMGNDGQMPSQRAIRSLSYDDLVNQYNRTQ